MYDRVSDTVAGTTSTACVDFGPQTPGVVACGTVRMGAQRTRSAHPARSLMAQHASQPAVLAARTLRITLAPPAHMQSTASV